MEEIMDKADKGKMKIQPEYTTVLRGETGWGSKRMSSNKVILKNEEYME